MIVDSVRNETAKLGFTNYHTSLIRCMNFIDLAGRTHGLDVNVSIRLRYLKSDVGISGTPRKGGNIL